MEEGREGEGEGKREKERERRALRAFRHGDEARAGRARSMAAVSAGSRKPGWSDSTSCRVPGETEQVTRLPL